MSDAKLDNMFLSGSLSMVFLKTAAPIILIMMVNGSFTLVDAYFLGEFVGADALTAVTSMFPAFMLIIALSTLVSNGFASLMARLIGAEETELARDVFSQAISLSLVVCVSLIVMFMVAGESFALLASNGNELIAQMSYDYIAILIFTSPLGFVLAINGDSLRCEGHISFMAFVSLLSVLFNGVFNYVLIVMLDMGVAGSAYGTALAQFTSLLLVFFYRTKSTNPFDLSVFKVSIKRTHWLKFLAIGAPSSLTYIGISLSSAVILYNLQLWEGSSYELTVGAYGINTRLMTFIFLPLLGLSMAFQTIIGNNVGAQQWQRANQSIKIALVLSFIYCVLFQVIVFSYKDTLGDIFVDDVQVTLEVARLLPYAIITLFLLGPQLILTMLFQAIGDAKRAAVLGLLKIYAILLPLTFVLPYFFGELGIWYAGPVAEVLALGVTLIVLVQRKRSLGNPFGVFFALPKPPEIQSV